MAAKEFEGKRVLVSGAGTGIGTGIGLAFAGAGADVVFHYSHSADGAESAAAAAGKQGIKATALQADFTSLDDVRNLADEAEDFLGGIDILVNNAGITTNKPFGEVTPEQFDTLYSVNIRAMFFLTQYAARGMTERGTGAVINLSSVHAFYGMTEHSIYAGTKGAIVSFTREVALELMPKGIRVNCIAPGWILVPNHLKAMPDLDEEAAARNIPAGFIGRPDDVAELVLFLASDAARYIVAQTIIIDGGQMSIMANTGDFRERRPWTFGKQYVPGT